MNGKVLIIDDEPDVSTYLAAALQANGYEPKIANSVDNGLEQLEQFQPDLICLDIMMPKKSGLTFYTQLCREHKKRHIPVIIISGVTQDSEVDSASFVPDNKIPPPDCILEKPIDLENFIRTVKRLIITNSGEKKNDK